MAEKMKGNEYNFDFYIYTENDIANGLTLNDAADMFLKHIQNETSLVHIGVNYSKIDESENFHQGLGSIDLARYENNELTVANQNDLGELKNESKIKNNTLRIFKTFEYDFKRANKPFESISDMFKRVDGESFDSYDFDFDRIVTIDEPYDDVKDSYDQFCKNVYDSVNVIQDEDDKHNLCCDWSEFIYRYYDKLKNFANKNWIKNNFDDPDDFVCEWIKETHLLLAGYGNEGIYNSLNSIIEQGPDLNSEIYQSFLKENIDPYMSAQTKEKQSQQKEKSNEATHDDEIVWTPISETEDENGNATVYSTKYKGEFYWITENQAGRFDIESHYRDRFFTLNEDFSNFPTRDSAERFFEDNIEDYLSLAKEAEVKDDDIENDNLLAINKEKTNEMLQSAGLQLPLEETLISFDNSIAYTTAYVKNPEKNITENLSGKIQTVQSQVNAYYDNSQDEEEFDLTNHSGRSR